jgi:Tfp pilus assembly protein PilN
MAAIPRNGTPQTLALWNATEVENPGSILEQRLAMPVTMPELGSLVATDTADAEGYAPAVALALAALEPTGLPVDFLHSRLAPPKAPLVSRPKMIAMVAGVLLAAFAAYAFIDLGQYQDQLNKVNAQLTKQAPDTQRAGFEIKRLDAAEKWLPDGPRFVAVMRDLTVLFPQAPNTIWATTLGNKEGDAWELGGLSPDQAQVQNLVNQMQETDRFLNARLAALDKETSGLLKFRIAFTYDPKGKAQAAAAPLRGQTRTRGRSNPTPTAVPATAPAAAR